VSFAKAIPESHIYGKELGPGDVHPYVLGILALVQEHRRTIADPTDLARSYPILELFDLEFAEELLAELFVLQRSMIFSLLIQPTSLRCRNTTSVETASVRSMSPPPTTDVCRLMPRLEPHAIPSCPAHERTLTGATAPGGYAATPILSENRFSEVIDSSNRLTTINRELSRGFAGYFATRFRGNGYRKSDSFIGPLYLPCHIVEI
jgi:hypothetical protein